MSVEPATLEIDGSAGSSGALYNQYLRDVVPLEIAIKFGSQEFKPRSAVEAQAIAARTYIYDRIRNVAAYGAINNSNQFQVFVPYYYDSLTSLQKTLVQIATNNHHYLSESSNATPIEALFGADNPGSTSEGNRPYLKSVADPISQPYGVIDGTTLGGMSSKGASRWSFGHTSSKGPVSPTDSHFPHDVDGSGNFWSVQYDSAARILTHYYTGVHIRDSTTAVVSPNNRWTPLQITWAGVCPSLMRHDEDCTASVQVQNTGVSDWDCSTASYALRYRWVKTGFPETTGSGEASLCGLAKGNAVTVSLNINDLPNWGAGAYTLKLDVTRTQSSQTFWFSSGGWPAFDIGLCVDGLCKAFVPHLVK